MRASLNQITLDLQAEIDRDSSRYIHHSLNVSDSASSSTSVSPSPAVPRAPSPKSTLIPGKISTAYAKIDKLSAEKCALAQRIIELVSRTRTRLDSDQRYVLSGASP
jgi:chromatin modification-related protein YNG2